jgi:hypothetical protein
MDCTNKYKNVNDMISRTLYEPKEELEKTKLAFTYEIKYSEKFGRGRPAVEAIEFTLKNITPKEIPDSWADFSEEHKTTIHLLRNTYFVDDKVIMKYMKVIGLKRVKELIKIWYDLKNDNKIANIKAYCNKVFQEEGKKAMENLASN